MNGWMEKSGYCCGENIGLKLDIENGGSCYAWIRCQLVQVGSSNVVAVSVIRNYI